MMKSYYQHRNSEQNTSVIEEDSMMKGSWPFSPQRGGQSERGRILNIMSNAVDEALDTILPAQPPPDILSRSLVVNPLPIHPLGIQNITKNEDHNPFESAIWQDLIKDPNTDLIQWLFNTPRTQEQEEDKEEYEPIDVVSIHHVLDQHEEENDDDQSFDGTAIRSRTTHARSSISSLSSSSSSSSSATKKQARETWEYHFQLLLQFRKEMGHCLVPHNYNWDGSRSLAQWVKRQRYQYKLWCKNEHSTLNQERIEILNKIEFVWSSHHVIWEEKLKELEAFWKQHGHCNVPSRYPENKQLSIWVRSQRRQYKLMCQQQQQQRTGGGSSCHHHHQDGGDATRKRNQSYMTRDRVEKLQSLGFVFDPRRQVQ